MVNVVIPTWRAKDTLPDALDSLVAQTKKMFIITISQDGDGEDYSDIIKEYDRRGLHIRHINNPNGGPGVARQRGMDADNMCDYVMFLDSDDLFFPNAIETLYTEAKRTNADIISSNFLTQYKDKTKGILDAASAPVTWCHGKIYKVQYLREKNIRFREDLRANEDSYFNLVAYNCTQNKLTMVEPTYFWRYNENSLTREGGRIDFFHKTWENYVFGQIKAIEKIVEIQGEMNLLSFAATMINIYKYMMVAMVEKLDISKMKESLKIIRDIPILVENFNKNDFWSYVHQHLQASHYLDEKLIFFPVRFSDWIRQWVKGDNECISIS